jgi:hypothetical protein
MSTALCPADIGRSLGSSLMSIRQFLREHRPSFGNRLNTEIIESRAGPLPQCPRDPSVS